jgi:hypothetical protein
MTSPADRMGHRSLDDANLLNMTIRKREAHVPPRIGYAARDDLVGDGAETAHAELAPRAFPPQVGKTESEAILD